MKNVLTLLIITILFSSCSEELTYCDKGVTRTVESYGIINSQDMDTNVVYRVSNEKIGIAIMFSGTVVTPVYLLGWSMYDPVGIKHGEPCGTVRTEL